LSKEQIRLGENVMNKTPIIIFIALLLVPSLASARWVDYSDTNPSCRREYSYETCTPPESTVTCTYYFSTQGCCCEGLLWVPDEPTNVTTTVVGNSITIQWDSDPTVIEYDLWWDNDPVISLGRDNRFTFTEDSFTHENLHYNKEYHYFLRAKYEYGDTEANFYAITGSNPNPESVDNWRSHISISKGNGQFSRPIYDGVPGNFNGWDRNVGDFNGDGSEDLLLYYNDNSNLRSHIRLSVGDGTFQDPIYWSHGGGFGGWHRNIGDFNGDGMDDIILYYNDNNNMRSHVFLSNGNGTFQSNVTWSHGGGFGGWHRNIGDFNGDGVDDFILYDNR
jgi:hypothetical protein